MKDKIKIAISGRSGCGNTTVTQIVAEKLKLDMINYTFHDMADEIGMDFYEFCHKAENDSQYDYALDKKQVELASGGNCVLGSRLAIWMLKDADLKVFLTAPPEIRASRIFSREGGTLLSQTAKTSARDERDHLRYKKLYEINNDDFSFVNLIIDTSNYDAQGVANLIIEKVKNLV